MRMTPRPLTPSPGRNGMIQASAMANRTNEKSKTCRKRWKKSLGKRELWKKKLDNFSTVTSVTGEVWKIPQLNLLEKSETQVRRCVWSHLDTLSTLKTFWSQARYNCYRSSSNARSATSEPLRRSKARKRSSPRRSIRRPPDLRFADQLQNPSTPH